MATGDSKPPTLDDIYMADLASLDSPAPSAAASTRFRPKAKGKARRKPETQPKPEPEHEPEPKPENGTVATVVATPSTAGGETAVASESGGDAMEVDEERGAGEEAEEEDFVMREIDVYFTPDRLDEDTFLYIMQYPLRPSWRLYELGEACTEVRVKPNSSKVEVDMSIDTASKNCDPDAASPLGLLKQTLSSSRAASVADYAVGVLRGNLVHLNHVDAVVQLRPSMSHANAGQSHTRQALQHEEKNDGASGPVKVGKTLSEDPKEHTEDSEPWISLDYHPVDNIISRKYHDKMVSEEGGPVDFTMSISDYVISLCPGASTGSKDTKRCHAIREMLSLPLEQRLRKWLTEISEVNCFDALMHLAPTYSEEDVLKVLPIYADLVRGLWVCKSSLLFGDDNACKRDFILLQFTKKDSIRSSVLEKLIRSIEDGVRKKMLDPLCKKRECLEDYKFISQVDSTFMKRYPHIVKEQECAWLAREVTILDSVKTLLNAGPRKMKNPARSNISSRGLDPNMNKARDDPVQGIENHIRSVLDTIFIANKVRSMQAVVRDLRQLAAKYASNRKEGSKMQALSNAAKNCASLPPEKLKDSISLVAAPVHAVYVAKPTDKRSLRNVLIKLFRDRGPNATLTKQEILEKGMELFKRDITEKEYHQVVTDICISTKDGQLMLKNGDEP